MIRALVFLLVLLVPGGLIIYLFGCWLLGEKPWDLWHEQVPVMYDGKEPYETWQVKMSQARAKQMEEEEGG